MKPRFFAAPADWRQWLAQNHDKERELVVGFHKRDSGRPSITWPESVDAALCFGWIDGVRRRVDEVSYTIRFTPRKPSSLWSAINLARVAELSKLGLMHAAGLKAFAARDQKKVKAYSYERERGKTLSKEYQKRLNADKKARAYFEAQAPWYRAAACWWVNSAKREETRISRLERLIADSAAGRAIPPLRRRTGV